MTKMVWHEITIRQGRQAYNREKHFFRGTTMMKKNPLQHRIHFPVTFVITGQSYVTLTFSMVVGKSNKCIKKSKVTTGHESLMFA